MLSAYEYDIITGNYITAYLVLKLTVILYFKEAFAIILDHFVLVFVWGGITYI